MHMSTVEQETQTNDVCIAALQGFGESIVAWMHNMLIFTLIYTS
jgi:hypothetical protein